MVSRGTISLGESTGRSSVISFDVGGTSLDACVIVDGVPTEVYEAEIESLPIRIPVFDIRTIGAGGGSIAWMDKGLLRGGASQRRRRPRADLLWNGEHRADRYRRFPVSGLSGARRVSGRRDEPGS